MANNLNPNLTKMHRSYTVDEVAALYCVHKTTVRNWIKTGLAVCDDRRPVLILGHELRRYLHARRVHRKRQCKPDELFCLRCRAPKKPAEGMVDYLPMTASTGRLVALCPTCGGIINQYSSTAKLAQLGSELSVSILRVNEHISERSNPLVDSTFI